MSGVALSPLASKVQHASQVEAELATSMSSGPSDDCSEIIDLTEDSVCDQSSAESEYSPESEMDSELDSSTASEVDEPHEDPLYCGICDYRFATVTNKAKHLLSKRHARSLAAYENARLEEAAEEEEEEEEELPSRTTRSQQAATQAILVELVVGASLYTNTRQGA